MNFQRMGRMAVVLGFAAFAVSAPPVVAEQPWTLSDNVRYASMGDSFAAGKGAIPVTQGFSYLLYREGVFGPIPNVTFAQVAVPGSVSKDVMNWQLPAVIKSFKPTVVTVMVGGNDLGKILVGVDPAKVIDDFGNNIHTIMCTLRDDLTPSPLVIVANQPDFPWLTEANPMVRVYIQQFNDRLALEAAACGARVADVFTEFDGRTGLFLHERNGAASNEPHPTNAGYRAIADAFKKAARD